MLAPSVPAKLVEDIYGVEERVQFDAERPEAPRKIRTLVQAQLNKESLEGDNDGTTA